MAKSSQFGELNAPLDAFWKPAHITFESRHCFCSWSVSGVAQVEVHIFQPEARRRAEKCSLSSTSGGFHRRRRRRHRGRQAAGRSTTFGAGCAAQRAAWAPSPPHLHSTRARSAPSIRAAGTSWPDLGVRAQLLRSTRASRRAAKGAGKSMANGEMVGSTNNSTFCPSSDAPGAGRSEAEAAQKKVGARTKS